MNKQKQVEAAARLEFGSTLKICRLSGFQPNSAKVQNCRYDPTFGHVLLPDYLHDHNAIQRLVDGMDEDELKRFQEELVQILSRNRGDVYVCYYECWQATIKELLEAVLRTHGKWEED